MNPWIRNSVVLFADRDVDELTSYEEFRFRQDTEEIIIAQDLGTTPEEVIITVDQLRRLVAELKKHGVEL